MSAVNRVDSDFRTVPLVASGISQRYDSHAVLDRIDLAITSGRVLGLIGKNGAGKSTLIRIMLGLLEPEAGRALVFGEPALRLSDRSKERLGYVPQQPDALAWLTAAQMFDYLARFYPRWDHRYAERMLARWQIPPDKLLAKLSPGERQRVDIIRVLAPQPELLVLDEPAAALDPIARRELLREIAHTLVSLLGGVAAACAAAGARNTRGAKAQYS
ncbi:MAG: ATP-binding cassette domain-containing protein [Gammaproteobacteria bacterium]